jgi:hypothetical protein
MKTFKQFLDEREVRHLINVDGEMKHRTNSEGNPIHPTDEGIRNFHRWFKGSAVTDEHGRPKVVHHGTTAGDFDTFDPPEGKMGRGHYFSSEKSFASKFAGPHGKVRPFYLKMENPTYNGFSGSGVQMVKSEHRDGGIFTKRNTDRYASKGTKEYIVHNPNQIKLADGNSGDFSPKSNKIAE